MIKIYGLTRHFFYDKCEGEIWPYNENELSSFAFIGEHKIGLKKRRRENSLAFLVSTLIQPVNHSAQI